MEFEFATAGRIMFGAGVLGELKDIAAGLGNRALVVTGSTPERGARVYELLEAAKKKFESFAVKGEPTPAVVKSGVGKAIENKVEFIVALGGGSVIDTAKAVAAMMANAGDLEDYLEIVGHGKPLSRRSLPVIAIPTTAGTGAEVTRNAVLGLEEHRLKVSLRSALMLPWAALVDPELTLTLPSDVTGAGGMDALTQLIESFLSTRSNPLTDGFCREGIPRAAKWLVKACQEGGNMEARTNMSLAALLSGLALANSGLGAVHGIAGPLGGMTGAGHGIICAALLSEVLEANLRLIENTTDNSPSPSRYDELAVLLTGKTTARPGDVGPWITRIRETLKIPSLADLGLKRGDIPELVEKSLNAGSMKANPVKLTPLEIEGILTRSL